jgi:signal transduction histidine kinase
MAKNPNIISEAPSSDSKPEASKKPLPQNETETDSREQLIAELREAVRARDDFLAIVAHELRNPLTPILLCLQLIRGTEQTADLLSARDWSDLDQLAIALYLHP